MRIKVIGADGKSRGYVRAVEGMHTVKGTITRVTEKTISVEGKQYRVDLPAIRPSRVPKKTKIFTYAK